ncbi:probable serine/threonine-protein kinase PBL28 [Juglans microcarpa x Juglans regia]|uniref:probable serine/threonine-protein kinase PBL28 n=1 Tax=Juglans microcarpa x Juglans regia TaxID=2249226 RepID=UPI001B7EED3B|nr:probable serine/threonine-protein kinase PBL28 [Juglans microcarpa x Juglans regia]
MRLFWRQQLPLLILIQLLEPGRTSQQIYAKALLTFKSEGGSPQLSPGRIWTYPCLRQQPQVHCYKLREPGVVSLLYKSRLKRVEASVNGDSGVPTITPLQKVDVKKPSNKKVAAIAGGVGATLVVVVIVVIVYTCLMRAKRFTRRTSETGSSLASPPVEYESGNASPYGGLPYPYDMQNLRQLTFLELEQATCNFSQSNIIGEGRFGLVYKGLLQDGSIVAVKRCLHIHTHHFVHEANRIAFVHHIHLVKLIGYYEDNHQQLLVYDYISNGNVGNHLYDSEGLPIGKLDMWRRLSIALGAAKGLEHLHSSVPPFLHMHFRTSNVLVDENFMAKVSDYGLYKLLIDGDLAESSSMIDCFLDPELSSLKNFSERSDVYSFGVFLLELISGHEAHSRSQSEKQENIVLQVRSNNFDKFVDKALGDQTMDVAKQMLELALQCLDTLIRRPSMKRVAEELEKIQASKYGHLHSGSFEIGAVKLGSELFK